MQNFVKSSVQRLSPQDMQRVRDDHLMTLRREIVPSKLETLNSLRHFKEGGVSGVTLGKTLCERVFYVRDYDVKPRDFHSWTPPRKQVYNDGKQRYISRFFGVLPTATYDQLLEHEREKLDQYVRFTQAWVELVRDPVRDLEVAWGRAHPAAPPGFASEAEFESLVTPKLRSIYDLELLRRESAAEPAAPPPGQCEQCKTDEYMIDTSDCGTVCTNCGQVASLELVDETSDAMPFGTQLNVTNSNRGCYEMTENFMKNLDLLEGSHNNKVTEAAKEFVKQNVNGRAVTINLIRRILKQGGMQRFYPAASVIYESVTGEKIEKCTKEERAQMHRFHVQYVYAFRQCPADLRRRKSSLTNNYLTCKFYQMLGLSHRIKYLHMLKCDKKIREHDRVFSWIVDHVRRTSEAQRVRSGTSFWAWYPTPND